MSTTPEPSSFEFIDVSERNTGDSEEPTRPTRNRFVPLIAIVAVLTSMTLIGLTISNRPDTPEVARNVAELSASTTTTTQPPTSVSVPRANLDESEPVAFVPWPDPPEDHDPITIIVPGPDQPMFGAAPNSTLLYVNTLGRPTVVDLDTGTVSQVLVATTRLHEDFGVESGSVVSIDGSSRTIPAATSRAITVHTFRGSPAPAPRPGLAGASHDLTLCLSEGSCQVEEWQSRPAMTGLDEIRRVSSDTDPAIYEALFGESWTIRGTYRYPPDDVNTAVRLPGALNADAWIVQPVSDE